MENENLFFWNKWTTQTKVLYTVVLAVFAISILFMLYNYFAGIESILDWEVEYEIQNKSSQIDQFKDKLFNIPVLSENFVVLQHFQPSLIKVNYLSAYLFLFFSSFAACLGLSVITTYKKLLWFIPGTALFVGWLAAFKLDLLAVFGFENNLMVGAMLIVYLGLAYLFHSIITRISFLKRFLSFVAVTIIFAIIIINGSPVHSPVIHLTNYGLIVPGVITFCFLIITGNEILQLALSVITYSKNTNPWVVPMNFLIVTILYVGNIITYYLYITKGLDWKLAYNVYLFFPICGILGIWSHRKRSILYQNILPFAPGGAFLYMVFAIVSFATIGYVLSISLTPLIKIFEYIFIACQISFGIAFFAYILRNFYKPMVHNMPIYKMVFDPRIMPHYVMRGLGLALLTFFLGQKLFEFRDSLSSSHYSLVGDAYLSDDEYDLAEVNYKEALKKYSGGAHASYSLASIYLSANKFQKGWDLLFNMREDEKTEYTYATLASSLKHNSNAVLGHFILNEAVNKFPDNPYINNNVAMTYYDLGIIDSAVYYLTRNKESEINNSLESNILGIATLSRIEGFDKEFKLNEKYKNDLAYRANAYALSNVTGNSLDINEAVPLDTNFGALELSYLNNYINANLGQVSNEMIESLESWLKRRAHTIEPNRNNAKIALSKALFFNGRLTEGLDIAMQALHSAPDVQVPYYSNFAGLLAHRAGESEKAYRLVSQANQALQLSSTENFARLNTGILALEVGDTAKAEEIFLTLAYLEPQNKSEYSAIYQSLNGDTVSSELHKACYLMYHPDALDKDYYSLLNQIKGNDLRTIVIMSLIDKEIISGETEDIVKLWAYIPQGVNDQALYKELNLLNLRSTQKAKNYEELKTSLSKLELSEFDQRWEPFFEAQVAHYTTDDTLKTRTLYDKSIKAFPANEEVWFEYVSFLSAQGNYELAYEVCSEYIRLYGDTKQMLLKYVDLAIEIRVLPFADEGVEDLELFMDADEYEIYKEKHQAKIDEIYGVEE